MKHKILLLIPILLNSMLSACSNQLGSTSSGELNTTNQGNTTNASNETEGNVWVLLPDSISSARWETDDRRFFDEAFSETNVDYTIVNAEGDARTQQIQAEQAITDGADLILLVNLDSGSGAAIIAAAREAGVMIMDYDRLTVAGPGADIYVSFDNVQVGRTMGEALEPLIDELPGVPNVVLLNGSPMDNNATLFREGYVSVAQPHFENGSWNLVEEAWISQWNTQEALVAFEQILTAANGKVDAVFAGNDNMANAAISVFKNSGIDPASIPISGQDATVSSIQNILAGDQAMTVYKPIRAEAYAAVEVALAMLRGEDLESLTGGLTLHNGTREIPFYSLTPLGITKENIADTVIADGFRTWDEICVGRYVQYCPEDW